MVHSWHVTGICPAHTGSKGHSKVCFTGFFQLILLQTSWFSEILSPHCFGAQFQNVQGIYNSSCFYVILTTRIHILQSLSLILLVQFIKCHPHAYEPIEPCAMVNLKQNCVWLEIYFVHPKHIQLIKCNSFLFYKDL